MENKVSVAIITCNREDYLYNLLLSLESSMDSIDELIIINDGKPLQQTPPFGILLQNEVNLGVCKSKNKALQYMLDNNANYIFVIEDDMVVLDKHIFARYIAASKVSGIQHFNYGPGSPFNRKQTIKNFDLHNRHLLDQHSQPNPKLIIDYGNDIKISLYEHTVAMFQFFTRECLIKCGMYDEDFRDAFDHVHFTQNIIDKGMHPPFWWFADIFESEKYLTEAEGAIVNSVIAKDESVWMGKVRAGAEIYKQKHGWYPAYTPKTSEEDVIKILKKMKQK